MGLQKHSTDQNSAVPAKTKTNRTLFMLNQKKKMAKIVSFEIFMAGISLYGMSMVVMQLILPVGSQMSQLFSYFDLIACVIFVLGFIHHLTRESHRIQYLFTWGILDLASAVPFLPLFRFLRLLRLVRITRVSHSTTELRDAIRRDPSASLLYLMLLLLLLVYTAACVGVLWFETNNGGGKIITGADALWFGLVTVSTVGYGDLLPVSLGAKICAAFLMFAGIGVFASLAGFLLEPLRRLARGGEKQITARDVAAQLDELKEIFQAHADQISTHFSEKQLRERSESDVSNRSHDPLLDENDDPDPDDS
jgi:voltage-gated potassium channel